MAIEYFAKKKDGTMLKITTDGFHFRAHDKDGHQHGQPFMKLETLLNAIPAEPCGAQNNPEPIPMPPPDNNTPIEPPITLPKKKKKK